MTTAPKLFISYSWSTPDHEQWVIDLAEELVSNGVDVVLDKWELREGHDSIKFMEQMVTDSSITKVILVCDRTYVEKADSRAAGVGTETQIISSEVYAKASQSKFVAVIAERDSEGKPYLPTYYKSRIYCDLSESDRYAENFEKLLRWVFDKPLHVRPELGKPPSFLADADTPQLGTSSLAKRVIDGFKNDKAHARGALDEYLSRFSENLEKFRIAPGANNDDLVIESIENFLPYRNEFIQVLTVMAQYADVDTHAPRVHRFFESLIPLMSRPEGVNQWVPADFDNFIFIVHELFLYAVSILLHYEKFDTTTILLSRPYFVPGNSEYGRDVSASYVLFRQYCKSLDVRNNRLQLRRLSLRADLLKKRTEGTGIPFRNLMQADFVCYMRAQFAGEKWIPETLIYASNQYSAFEIFARSKSKAYLEKIFPLLGAADLAIVHAKLDEFTAGKTKAPSWQFESISPSALFGADDLGTLQ